MKERSFSFIFIATIIFGVLIILQSVLFKPKMPENAAGEKSEQAEKAQDSDAQDSDAQDSDAQDSDAQDSDAQDSDAQDSDAQDSDAQDSDAQDSEAKETDSKSPEKETTDSDDASDKSGDDKNAQSAEQTEQENDNDSATDTVKQNKQADDQKDDDSEATVSNKKKPKNPRKYVTLGSVSPESDDRFLTTLTTRGASIQRMELNARYQSGKLRYREIEIDHGYLGNLELTEVIDQGCMVNCVGHGTPAENAGILVGDVIVGINDSPVKTIEDIETSLFHIEPGESISLKIQRKKSTDESAPAQSLEVDVTLAEQPMELLRPLHRESKDWLNSLQLTLNSSEDKTWPEIDKGMRSDDWLLRETDESGKALQRDGQPMVEFVYTIDNETMQKVKLHGPVEIVKRFWLTEQGRQEDFDRAFHLNFEFEIRNLSDKKQTLNYQIVGPTGTPIEGWWYQNKIHGGTWSIGYSAGARDVFARNAANPFVFVGGPEIVAEKASATPEALYVINPKKADDHQKVYFIGVDTQYFAAALFPGTDETVQTKDDIVPLDMFSAFAWVAEDELPNEKNRRKTVDVTFRAFSKEVELGPKGSKNANFTQGFHFFAGPKEPALLKQYGLQDCRTYGWAALFAKPLVSLLRLFYWPTGSYALAIIMLTVLVRSLMIPISRKAALNAQMMTYLQPEIKRIAETYKDDMQKRASAQRELFARYKYNPLGGCLLMFLQLPIFMGLYRGLSTDIGLRDQPLIPGLDWCSNLAAPDQLFRWESWSWMPDFIVSETGWLGPYFNLLPILTIVLFLVQQKMFMPPATDDQQKMTQRMMTFMMVFMGVLFFKVPSGLCLYFITSSIWGIIERKMIPKPKLPENLPPLDGSKGAKKKRTEHLPGKEAPQIVRDEAKLNERKRKDRERRKRLKEK